jgi:hypothetical protein
LETTSNDLANSTDVNMLQTTKSSRQKSCNQQIKNSSDEQEEANTKETQPGNNNKKGKKKFKFPCLTCKEDQSMEKALVMVLPFLERVKKGEFDKWKK